MQLWELLADLVNDYDDILRMVDSVGVPRANLGISRNGKPVNNWHKIVREAGKSSGRIQAIVDVISMEFPRRASALNNLAATQFVESAKTGFQKMKDCLDIPDVKQALAEYAEDYKDARLQFRHIRHYKEMHEDLHSLQLQCYILIRRESREYLYSPTINESPSWFDVDASNATHLGDSEHQIAQLRSALDIHGRNFDDMVDKMQELAKTDSWRKIPHRWLDGLVRARDNLNTFLAGGSYGDLDDFHYEMMKVFQKAPQAIHIALRNAAQDAPLRNLAESIRTVEKNLTDGDTHREIIEKLTLGASGLCDYDRSLTNLIDEHEEWQDVDVNLAMMESQSSRTKEETIRRHIAGDLSRIQELCKKSRGKWLERLRNATDKLDRALHLHRVIANIEALGDRAQGKRLERLRNAVATLKRTLREIGSINEAFEMFRENQIRQFASVDAELNSLCAKLAGFEELLANITEQLT